MQKKIPGIINRLTEINKSSFKYALQHYIWNKQTSQKLKLGVNDPWAEK